MQFTHASPHPRFRPSRTATPVVMHYSVLVTYDYTRLIPTIPISTPLSFLARLFFCSQVYDWQSAYQSAAVPIPTFDRKDPHSVNFTVCGYRRVRFSTSFFLLHTRTICAALHFTRLDTNTSTPCVFMTASFQATLSSNCHGYGCHRIPCSATLPFLLTHSHSQGRLVRELLRLTDPRGSTFIDQFSAWCVVYLGTLQCSVIECSVVWCGVVYSIKVNSVPCVHCPCAVRVFIITPNPPTPRLIASAYPTPNMASCYSCLR
jgi:hypothetical protein